MAPDLSSSTAMLRELVLKSADAYGFTVEALSNGRLVGVPDGTDRDWFILWNCGHVSALFVSPVRAVAAQCPICEEAKISEQYARLVLSRLPHLRVLLDEGGKNVRS